MANEAETVFIPDMDEERGTVCISSQVGCTLTCTFCHTGTQLLVRNLDIGGNRRTIHGRPGFLWRMADARRQRTAIVQYRNDGHGRTVFNLDNVATALEDRHGWGRHWHFQAPDHFVHARGVVPMMKRCGEELGVNLAVSLHAATDELRDS